MTTLKKTPKFDWESGEFVVSGSQVLTATGLEAVQEIAQKAQQTARGVYLIYANLDDNNKDHKYGSDVYDIVKRPDLTQEAQLSEIKRAVKDALIYDEYITDVTDIEISKDGDEVTAAYVLSTVFDKEVKEKGVILNG